MNGETPREGAVRKKGSETFTNPGDLLFSVALMSADEFYRGGQWIPIYELDEAVM